MHGGGLPGPSRRLLAFVRPYRRAVAGAVVAACLSAFFGGATIGMVLPVFDDVLGRASADRETGSADLLPLLRDDLRRASGETWSALRALDPPAVVSSVARLGSAVRTSLRRSDPGQALLFLVIGIALLVGAKNATGFAQVLFVSRVENSCVHDLRRRMYRKLLDLDLAWFVRARSGEMISRFTADVDRLRGAAKEALVNVVKQSTFLVVCLGIAVWASWRLTLVSMIVLPVSVLVLLRLGKRLRATSHLSQERMADFTTILQETLDGIRVVKAFSMERFEKDRFVRSLSLHRAMEVSLQRLRALAPPLTELLGALTAGFLFWFGGRAVLSGDGMTTGRFLLFLGATLSMIDPVKNLGKAHARIQAGLAAGERVLAVLDTVPSVVESPGAVEIETFRDALTVDHVWFAYGAGEVVGDGGDEAWVLRDVCMEIGRGEMVAVVGPSGAGKTTLADLIPRFHDPVRGRVLIDGRDLREVRLGSLRSLIGFVTQEPVLFNDTVRNNITCGADPGSIPEEEVVRAAESANALDFIEALPLGFDTVVGERGAKLSGGQRQRITIARAILRNPAILILDEATSSLDAESERLVQEAILGLVAGCTTLVIAHRLSTVERADRIVVLDRGGIVESGTHSELLELGGLYSRLHELQLAPGPAGSAGGGGRTG